MIVGSKNKSTRGMISVFAVTALAGAALSLASLGGCREDPAALQAIKKAGHSINTVAGGAEAAVAIDRQETAFKQALSELGAAKVDPSDPLASATGVLTAASQLGSAGTASEAAQASLGNLSGLRSELRSAMLQWSTVNAVAESAKYDPAPRLSEIDAQLTASRGEQQQAQERLATVVREQDALMSSAKEKAEQAAKFEQESVKLREESRRMKASDAQPVLAKALEAKRQCDELRLELARIEADATLLEPKKLGLNQRLQELEIGIKSVEGERVRVQKRGEEASSVETQARAQVATTAGVVDGFAKRIADEREKALIPALDEVIDLCRKSASAAGTARGTTLAAIAKLRLGEVLLVKAGEARQHAAMMTDLAAVKPALAGQAAFAEAAKTASESDKSATAEAKEALEAARSAYKGLRFKDEADQATQTALLAYLTQIGGLTPEDAETPPADGTPAAEGTPGEGPEKDPTPPADASAMDADVKAFLTELGEAVDAVEADRVASLVHVDDASQEQMTALRPMIAATLRLDEACKAKFKIAFGDHMKKLSPKGESDEFESMPSSADLADAKAEVNGDDATVTLASGVKVPLKKVDGAWKVNLTKEFDSPAQLAQVGAMAPVFTKLMTELASEVQADTYATIDEVSKAMMSKLQAAMTGGAKKDDPAPPAGGGKGGSGTGGG